MDDGEVRFGFKAIAAEVSRVIGREVSPKKVAYWAHRGVLRTAKRGHFRTATKSSIAEDLTPPKSAGEAA